MRLSRSTNGDGGRALVWPAGPAGVRDGAMLGSASQKYARVLAVAECLGHDEAVVGLAFAIAAPRATVSLVHVVQDEPTPNPLYSHYTDDCSDDPEANSCEIGCLEEYLKSLVSPALAGDGMHVVASVIFSDAIARAIVAEARRQGAEAIVIGAARRRNLRRLFARSVSDEVLRRTELPVFVAHPS